MDVTLLSVNSKRGDTMLGNPGIYAVKKRKKPIQKPKNLPGIDGVTKSNPSKRHRDRLNGELDRLTDLLPFSEDVRSRLDKLSVLRLSVGYLRVKNFFRGATGKSQDVASPQPVRPLESRKLFRGKGPPNNPRPRPHLPCRFLSDLVHQSVFELIHTDDRGLFRQQLHFALNPQTYGTEQDGDVLQSGSDTLSYDPEQLPPENSSFLERRFVCRFRCLLDNSSGFLALKFQGRLKYLHGQNFLGDNGVHPLPQLALFSIATPIQPPSILEIRTKTVFFQTRHKLDFTPTGIDNRGTVVLGYSEMELCMRGSGYQFIHAADMMYCADNHIHMIKTGESRLIVFRLLTKSGGWMWVQANAKLVYKAGRPDFIIVRQRVLDNTEGEEHLRQRRLQLPFSFTTGEALLYETGPTLDVNQLKASMAFGNKDKSDVPPSSLLGCFLNQDEASYTQTVETSVPIDQVFMDTQALVSVPGDPWKGLGSMANDVMVKEEGDQSVTGIMDALEKLVHDGDLCTALQSLEVDTAELMDWENTLQKLNQDDGSNNFKPELDSVLTNELFAYMDKVLFNESGELNLDANQPSCLANNNKEEPFSQVPQPNATGLCEPQLFQRPSANHADSSMNGLCGPTQNKNNGPVTMKGKALTEASQKFNSTQKLSHYGPLIPQTDTSVPSLQQMQFNHVFSPSIELPELTLSTSSASGDSVPFESCLQAPISHTSSHQGIPWQMQNNQPPQHSPNNGIQVDPMALKRQLLQGSFQQPSNVVLGVVDSLPSLIPCKDFSSPSQSSTNSVSNPFPNACLQKGTPFQTQNNHRVQPWTQSQQQKLPCAGIMQNGHHNLVADCHSQPSDSQRLSLAGLWPQSITELNHTPQGELADGQQALRPSCMFEKHLLPLSDSRRVEGAGFTPSVPLCQRGSDSPLDQSPPQGTCFFQWGRSDPVVGTSAIVQENVSISPPSQPHMPNMSTAEDILSVQRYLECNTQTQVSTLPAESNGLFPMPPLIDRNIFYSQ
ncbi:aryl hydrocarbon receptor-like [Lampris incognitus]|uniref:aryl hydrocarbon receptor-like n=1 Tax=Lampris incognitus TaxID=2546036 RepID=UPI0024B594BC|nr:aryl hydrocarbon receptor-like [Lampris incognitus]